MGLSSEAMLGDLSPSSTVFVTMGPLPPQPSPGRALPCARLCLGKELLRQLCSPSGALVAGCVGSVGEALRQRLPQRSVDARNLGIC